MYTVTKRNRISRDINVYRKLGPLMTTFALHQRLKLNKMGSRLSILILSSFYEDTCTVRMGGYYFIGMTYTVCVCVCVCVCVVRIYIYIYIYLYIYIYIYIHIIYIYIYTSI